VNWAASWRGTGPVAERLIGEPSQKPDSKLEQTQSRSLELIQLLFAALPSPSAACAKKLRQADPRLVGRAR